MIRFSLMFCLALYFLSPPQSLAQAGPQGTCDFPLVVAGWNRLTQTGNELLMDLHPEDLVIQFGATPATLESMSVDGGPKRVALVLDASPNVPDNEWNLEAQMAARFVEAARPEDRFLLLLEGVDSGGGSFLPAEEIDSQLRELAFNRPSTGQSTERTYDTLFDAAQHFDPPAFGDAMVLFGHPEDVGSKTDPDQLLQVILSKGLRLYGFSFRDPLQGNLTPGLDLNKPLPASVRSLADPKLAQMSRETGYFVSFHSILSLSQPSQMRLFEGFLDDVYAGVAQPYRLRIRTPATQGPTALQIDVRNAKDRVPRADRVYYPHSIYPCP